MLAQARSKTRLSDADKQRAILMVVPAARGVTRMMPVIADGEVIAWAGWSARRGGVLVFEHKPWMRHWLDRWGCFLSFASVDDMINQITSNLQFKQCFFFKDPNLSGTVTANHWSHLYNLTGWPAAGVWNGTALTARQHNDQEVGAIMHGGNVSPKVKCVISGTGREGATASTDVHVYCLYDQVLSYDQCVNSNTLQSFTNTLAPQRYISGAGAPGLQIMASASTAIANTTSFSSIKYTNVGATPPAGIAVPGATLTTFPNSSVPGPGVPAISEIAIANTNTRTVLTTPMRNGDSGVCQLDSYTMSASNTDAINWMLSFPLGWFPNYLGTDTMYPYDLKNIAAVPVVQDGACLCFAAYFADAQATLIECRINVAWE